ncbi:MAG: DNA primase small subunit PriS [Candidatus Bathyarchaeota archaeon]|nr:DNA primase small subunit PriS [Candidatus Bathyarchaeota archaeon]MDH5494216.1 DNA primase small subunit PriS [Candidatus Bathyarchaeota archaeon]
MLSPSVQAIREKFAQYYKNKGVTFHIPKQMEKREFGFLLFKKRIMLRHRKFENINVLKAFLSTIIPSDVYYSSAYFEEPEREMKDKGWLGADLVFDIDADHIPTPCGKVHDTWVCSHCSFAGKGLSPEKCPSCGEAKFDTKTWMCDECLKSAKKETVKLLDMLMEDLGFAEDEIKVYFSGNRGYHVHVENENIRFLDSMARKEITDYIIGLGFKVELHRLIDKDKGRVVVGPNLKGWRGRIANRIYEFLTEATSDEIEKLGLKKHVAGFLIKNKKTLLENWKNKEWISVKGVGPKNWKKIIQWIVDQQSAKIDTVVTTDTHRLIRLAGSLHGKTGFMKVEAPLSGLDKFDPLKEAVAFKEGQINVNVDEAPKFQIGDTYYGPFKNTSHEELPTAAALFLLCKGAAQVAE